ncbi:hypothetical protein C8R21_12153 [Nitrosospira multiformis]|jgi:hypothetical protein|uniref:Uncharacterized protein n=1 Tax=Nitrosospira multiformis TaxID=1231 RepID=A0A2T5I7Y2_9PROT|nr:hypothetical protein C8R21_12153 [Nitrosospira multiformis]
MLCLEMGLTNGNQNGNQKRRAGEVQELSGGGGDDPGNSLTQAINLESA